MATDYEKRLLRVLDYVHANLDGDLSLDRLAEEAALSRFHFHRVFSGVTGETVAGFIRRIRLHHAALLLVTTNAPIPEVATRCGYPNPKSFARTFREAFARTPSEFRARNTPLPPLTLKEKGRRPMFDVEIRDEPARRLAVIPYQGPYDQIGATYEKAGQIVLSRGMGPEIVAMIGLYFDDPSTTAPEDLRAVAGFEVRDTAEIGDPLEEMRLEGGKHAILTLKGPYAQLASAYEYLYGDWLPGSGEVPRDAPPFELYVNSPMDTAPEELITLIGVPLQ